jgi:hypothetical protein
MRCSIGLLGTDSFVNTPGSARFARPGYQELWKGSHTNIIMGLINLGERSEHSVFFPRTSGKDLIQIFSIILLGKDYWEN